MSRKIKNEIKYKNLTINEDGKVIVERYAAVLLPEVLSTYGCKSAEFPNILKKMKKFDEDELIAWINKEAENGQKNISQQILTEEFQNLTDWAHYLIRKRGQNTISNEISIIFDILATENYPEAETENDIDFEELYKCLSDLMSGRPTGELINGSKEFFMQTLKEIHSEIMSMDITEKTAFLRRIIKESTQEFITDDDVHVEKLPRSNSPLELSDENINPFNIPKNMLLREDECEIIL